MRFLTYDQVRDLLQGLRGHSKVEMLVAPAKDVGKEPASAPADAASSQDAEPASSEPVSSTPPAIAPKAGPAKAKGK